MELVQASVYCFFFLYGARSILYHISGILSLFSIYDLYGATKAETEDIKVGREGIRGLSC